MTAEDNQYERLKKLEGQEELSLEDLAFMLGLPKDLIREHLLPNNEKISIKDLQQKTRQLVDEHFKNNTFE